jgi:hypothetical protein
MVNNPDGAINSSLGAVSTDSMDSFSGHGAGFRGMELASEKHNAEKVWHGCCLGYCCFFLFISCGSAALLAAVDMLCRYALFLLSCCCYATLDQILL